MQLQRARLEHLPGIVSIYNDVVANSTAIYTLQPVDIDDRRAWLEGRERDGFPVLVMTDNTGVLGFSSFGHWRGAWPGYRFTVEHSVHVRADRRGTGIGRGLLEALFPLAADMNMHVMIGAVDADNLGSIRFHERLGFQKVALFKEVGHKFGRWLDLVFLQRFLDAPGTPRA